VANEIIAREGTTEEAGEGGGGAFLPALPISGGGESRDGRTLSYPASNDRDSAIVGSAGVIGDNYAASYLVYMYTRARARAHTHTHISIEHIYTYTRLAFVQLSVPK